MDDWFIGWKRGLHREIIARTLSHKTNSQTWFGIILVCACQPLHRPHSGYLRLHEGDHVLAHLPTPSTRSASFIHIPPTPTLGGRWPRPGGGAVESPERRLGLGVRRCTAQTKPRRDPPLPDAAPDPGVRPNPSCPEVASHARPTLGASQEGNVLPSPPQAAPWERGSSCTTPAGPLAAPWAPRGRPGDLSVRPI